MHDPHTFWPRAILLVDMNAFFASIEQIDRPELRGRPIGVTNGQTGTCIITSSYEARRYGIKTGMRIKEARCLCPDFIQVPARPQRYAEVSTRIMSALETVTPDVEVFSVDEAFLDITHCQRLWGAPELIAQQVKQIVSRAAGGVTCSVGVSGDKTTAKYAAKLVKPDGLTIIPPWEAKARLRDVPVTELCGIASGIGRFLADRGVLTCGDMHKLPIGALARRFGNPGRRIWLMAQGDDPEPVHTSVAPPKSMGHGKVMPPDTKDPDLIRLYLLHMSEKLAARLRRHNLEAQQFAIGLRYLHGWLGGKYRSSVPASDGRLIYQLGLQMLLEHWHGEGVHQVQITALDPRPVAQQRDLFQQDNPVRQRLFRAMDAINQRYGELTLSPARLLNRSDMPNVIAPAWKPDGPRQSI